MLRYFQAVALSALLFAGPARAGQGTIVTPTAGPRTMAEYATILNAGLLALQSCNSGTSPPANGVGGLATQYQCWADTTSNPVLFKRFDGTSWAVFGSFNTSGHVWTSYNNGAPIAAVATSGSAADLTTGTLPAARLPFPAASTLGGIQSLTCPSQQWLNQISTAGAPSCTAIVKADVGLWNVDNSSDATKWAAVKTLTNTTFNCSSTGNVCTVRIGADVSGLGSGVAAALAAATNAAGGLLTNSANVIPNSALVQAGAATLRGNPTASTANVQDFTIQGLTARGTPDATNDKIPLYDAAATSIKYVTPSQIAAAAGAGVTSLGGQAGAVTIPGGSLASTVLTVPRYDAAQSLTDTQMAQGRSNIYAAPFAALAYNGMQLNGSMEVDQENAGASVTFAAGSVNKYALDGVFFIKTGTNAFTTQQVASIFPGYGKELKLTVTTAQPSLGSDAITLQIPIEGYRLAKAGWGTSAAQPITVGLWVKSSVAGGCTVQLSDAVANTASGGITFAAGTAQFLTLTFPAQASWAGSTTNGLGGNLNFYISSGSLNIPATVGNTFEMTGLIILPGSEAPSAARSPLIMRPYEHELISARRYLRLVAPVGAGKGLTTTSLMVSVEHPGMRITPAVSATGAISVADGTSGFTQSAANASILDNAPDFGRYSLANFSGLAANITYFVRGNSAGVLKLDARF